MAIELQNSVFVHIPKTGGRWVSAQLINHCNGSYIGDPVYDAHVLPDTDKHVFAFIRHPITMLNSLWMHRSRKHGNTRHKDWNWQEDHDLERICGDSDYLQFFENIAANPGIVFDYYMSWVERYEANWCWFKYESLASELVSALNLYDEKHDTASILKASNKKLGFANNPIPIAQKPVLVRQIISGESRFCDHYNYTAKQILEGYVK